MFEQLVKRSDRVRQYTTGPFAKERHLFLRDLHERGQSFSRLGTINRFLLGIAERVDIYQRGPVTKGQVIRAAGDWSKRRSLPGSKEETRRIANREFVSIARRWLRFLGKWRDPDRNPKFGLELEIFLEGLRDERGFTDQTLSTREGALRLFFRWLETQGVALSEIRPATIAAYFVQHKTRNWKKATVVAYVQSLRTFFRFASQRGWCAPGLADTIQRPTIYSMTGLPEGPTWEQTQQLIAGLNTERPSHIRDRAIVLLLAVYGLRMGEVCRLTLDDLDWAHEKIRVRRLKNKRIQEYPLTVEVGNAILKYLRQVRPRCSARILFLTLHTPHRPMTMKGAAGCMQLRTRALGCRLPHYGPHALRHACATHLLAQGFSLKVIGDHLGHCSARSAQIYAKVDRENLKQVAAVDLSGFTAYTEKCTYSLTPEWAEERVGTLREVADFGLGGPR